MTGSSNPAAMSRRSLALVIDSESAIRQLVGRIVSEFDMVPMPADSVPAALNVIQSHRAELACAIVGSLLPAMHVISVANKVQLAAPELPLILMSSLPPRAIPGRPLPQLFGFVPKPFALAELRGVLQRVVDHQA